MSWHFFVREKGGRTLRFPGNDSVYHMPQVTLRHEGELPAMQDFPQAGKPWRLPPPLAEGQLIRYRFYDDTTKDQIVTAVAVYWHSKLAWVLLDSVDRPRKMVGTVNRKCCPGGKCST